jgi:hypothetical protein
MSTSMGDLCIDRRSNCSRRRGMWSPDRLQQVSTMVSIIRKLHVHLGAVDPQDVRHIYRIGGSLLEHVKHLCPEEYTDAWRGTIIQDSK